MTRPAIEVQNVSKTFVLHNERRDSIKERFVRGGAKGKHLFHALDDVSFEVPHGSTFGLIGHNGSGKSTMLKVLAGVYRPNSGRVMVDGRVSALLELGAGFHGELSGRENIYLNGAILGLGKRQIEQSIEKIVDFAGLGEFIDSPVKVYSSGMYVRLGFAVAVTLDPEILIVDEIIAVGDEEFQRKCFDYLFELRKRGTTIALVTHSLGLAADLCDGAIWLDHGRTKMVGDVRKVIDGYLHSVNEKEAARREAEAALAGDGEPSVLAPVPRQGSGEVRMSHVELLGPDGAKVRFVSPGEPCTIRIHVRAREAVRDVEVGLALIHESGMMLAGPNSGQENRAYDFAPNGDTAFVDFHLDQLPVQPGTFAISTSLITKGHTYDYADREVDFIVRADHAVTEPGLTRIVGRWSPATSVPVRG
jgi:ABC-2 type transport system ATP-binding protein/lipopolysaccharide transport system ATP-binding protein